MNGRNPLINYVGSLACYPFGALAVLCLLGVSKYFKVVWGGDLVQHEAANLVQHFSKKMNVDWFWTKKIHNIYIYITYCRNTTEVLKIVSCCWFFCVWLELSCHPGTCFMEWSHQCSWCDALSSLEEYNLVKADKPWYTIGFSFHPKIERDRIQVSYDRSIRYSGLGVHSVCPVGDFLEYWFPLVSDKEHGFHRCSCLLLILGIPYKFSITQPMTCTFGAYWIHGIEEQVSELKRKPGSLKIITDTELLRFVDLWRKKQDFFEKKWVVELWTWNAGLRHATLP